MNAWKDEFRELLDNPPDSLVDAAHDLYSHLSPFELYATWDAEIGIAVAKRRYEMVCGEMGTLTPAAKASLEGLRASGIFTDEEAERILEL